MAETAPYRVAYISQDISLLRLSADSSATTWNAHALQEKLCCCSTITMHIEVIMIMHCFGKHSMVAIAVVLGSTTNFDLPQEEVEAFQADHSQNGGSAGPSNEEDDEDESLVYVPSPKVPHSYCFCGRKIHASRHRLWEALNEPTVPCRIKA